MEQWLKRVPDDPGGLLRRKFQQLKIGFDEATSPAKTLRETGNPMRLILTIILFLDRQPRP